MADKMIFTPGGDDPSMGANEQLRLNVNVKDLTTFKCQCGHNLFQVFYIIKKVSALQSPVGKEAVVPVQVFSCTNCGAVPKEFGGNLIDEE